MHISQLVQYEEGSKRLIKYMNNIYIVQTTFKFGCYMVGIHKCITSYSGKH